MTDYNIISDGWHELSGFCDCTIRDEYSSEDINALIVRIDNKNYLCYEDPHDGYRSHSELQETDKECTNTFPPQRVMVKHYDKHYDKGIQFYSPDFELILLIGTDNYDDYYPGAVWEWHPENLPINKGIHKQGYEMPGELTMKIHQQLTTSGTSAGEIIDIVDHYYRLAYAKGRMDVAKRLEETIGDLDEFRDGTPIGQYVITLEAVIAEIQNIDPAYKK